MGEEEEAEGHNLKKKSSEGSYWLQEKSLHAAQNLNLLLLTPSVLAGCISMFKSVELNIIEQTISSWAFGINGLYLFAFCFCRSIVLFSKYPGEVHFDVP